MNKHSISFIPFILVMPAASLMPRTDGNSSSLNSSKFDATNLETSNGVMSLPNLYNHDCSWFDILNGYEQSYSLNENRYESFFMPYGSKHAFRIEST